MERPGAQSPRKQHLGASSRKKTAFGIQDNFRDALVRAWRVSDREFAVGSILRRMVSNNGPTLATDGRMIKLSIAAFVIWDNEELFKSMFYDASPNFALLSLINALRYCTPT